MKKYRVVKLMEIGAGAVMALAPDQVVPRQHRLEPVGEGHYRTKELLQFKAGEVIGLVGYVLPKAHADRVELLEESPDPADESGGADGSAAESIGHKSSGLSGLRRGRR